jgi:hypothetical protein
MRGLVARAGIVFGRWMVRTQFPRQELRKFGSSQRGGIRKGIILTETDINSPPVKPTLSIVDVNLTGTLYTWKLAVHYFRKQPDTEERDRCFIITGSMVAWIDSPVRRLALPYVYQEEDQE